VVRAYPGDSASDVVVADGLVALNRPGGITTDSLLLHPGDLGRVRATGPMTRRTVVADRYLSWTAGELAFYGVPLREVLVDVGRWYDANVQLADASLGAEVITASFKDEPLTDVLDLVATAGGLVVEQRGNQFLLRRKRG
jgi:ferric-dicitrate binding protein FerR (iron transport regulator)